MKFGDELDKYVILKLSVNEYKPTSSTLERDFQVVGSEARDKIRRDEKKLLKLNFRHWLAPYSGKLKGWRNNSPIYILYKGRLVSGVYLCDQNEFNEGVNWGQLHYFFTESSFKQRGLHSVLVNRAIDLAKSWDLHGVIINTDRYLLPNVYIRWGAVPWKQINKVHYYNGVFDFMKRLLRRGIEFIKASKNS